MEMPLCKGRGVLQGFYDGAFLNFHFPDGHFYMSAKTRLFACQFLGHISHDGAVLNIRENTSFRVIFFGRDI